jgi:hypothetical protein
MSDTVHVLQLESAFSTISETCPLLGESDRAEKVEHSEHAYTVIAATTPAAANDFTSFVSGYPEKAI